MKTIRSQLRVLLAKKETRERRTISLREVQRETSVPMSTVMGLANNTLRAVPLDGLLALCEYLNCEVGDVLRIEEVEMLAPATADGWSPQRSLGLTEVLTTVGAVVRLPS